MRVDEARAELCRWGAYWRWREQHGWAPVSPSQTLIDIARLGCIVQRGRRTSEAADDMRVPAWVQTVDAALEQIPMRRRAAIVQFYLRSNVKRTKAKSIILERAELNLAQIL